MLENTFTDSGLAGSSHKSSLLSSMSLYLPEAAQGGECCVGGNQLFQQLQHVDTWDLIWEARPPVVQNTVIPHHSFALSQC